MEINTNLLAVVALIGVALAFDYINGFHDAANSIATVVSTRVLSPGKAVVWAAFFNFIAAFTFGTAVAKTVGSGLVDLKIVTFAVIFAGLMGAIIWDLITWYYGLPTSSSHALIGGFDWKRTNNNLEFGGTNVSATGAEVAQFSVAYTGRANDAYGSSAFTGTLFHSPGGLTDKNEDANFRSLRAFADAKYTYVNLQGQRITSLPRDFSWHLTGELQFSNENLLGSEQIGASAGELVAIAGEHSASAT